MVGTGNSLMKNDNVCFVLHQHVEIAFYGISTLKEQSKARCVAQSAATLSCCQWK